MTMARIRIGLFCLAGAFAMAACGKAGDRTLFDGNYYPVKLQEDRDDRRTFTVSVRNTEQGLAGAREAGRHEGVRFCVETFGSSDIAWKNGGPDAPEAALLRSGGDLIFSGRCREW